MIVVVICLDSIETIRASRRCTGRFRPFCLSLNSSHWWERNAPPSSDPINYLLLASVSLRDKYSRRVMRGWMKRGEVHEVADYSNA